MFRPQITRPDKYQVDRYLIELDESLLLHIEDGLVAGIRVLEADVRTHGECAIEGDSSCRVAEGRLGLIDGPAQVDCTEDLAFLHNEIGKLYAFLNQSRWLRKHNDETVPYAEQRALGTLEEIKTTVTYREKRSREDTAHLPRLDDSLLKVLDEQH